MLRADEFADQICQTLPGSDKVKLVSERDRQQFEAGWSARGEADIAAALDRRPAKDVGGAGVLTPLGEELDLLCERIAHDIRQVPPPAAQPAEEEKP